MSGRASTGRRTCRRVAESPASRSPTASREPVPMSSTIGRCATERRGIIVNDYAGAACAIQQYVAAGLKRVMSYPLLVHDRLVGVTSMSRSGEDSVPFIDDDVATLASFAAHVGVAVE